MTHGEVRIGVSLLHLGNWSGTGFYTGQVLQALGLFKEQGIHAIGLSVPGSERAGQTESHLLPSIRLRWPFRFGAEWIAGCHGLGLDLVHYPAGVGPPRRDIPVVATIHDVSPFLYPEWLPPHKAAYLRMVFTTVSRISRLILADSHWQAEHIAGTLAISRERILVLPPSIPSTFGPSPGTGTQEMDQQRPYFLAVGTLEPRKNISRLLDAWRVLIAPHDLVVVGRWGWMYEGLRTRLNLLGQYHVESDGTEIWEIQDGRRVIRKEHLPTEELVHLYQSAEALIYPSLFEGFGLPVLEALSCGCPVLTSWQSPMEEIAGDAGWYFDPGEEDSLLATLRTFLRERDQREKKIRLGLERAACFSLPEFAQGLLSAYQRVLE